MKRTWARSGFLGNRPRFPNRTPTGGAGAGRPPEIPAALHRFGEKMPWITASYWFISPFQGTRAAGPGQWSGLDTTVVVKKHSISRATKRTGRWWDTCVRLTGVGIDVALCGPVVVETAIWIRAVMRLHVCTVTTDVPAHADLRRGCCDDHQGNGTPCDDCCGAYHIQPPKPNGGLFALVLLTPNSRGEYSGHSE